MLSRCKALLCVLHVHKAHSASVLLKIALSKWMQSTRSHLVSVNITFVGNVFLFYFRLFDQVFPENVRLTLDTGTLEQTEWTLMHKHTEFITGPKMIQHRCRQGHANYFHKIADA